MKRILFSSALFLLLNLSGILYSCFFLRGSCLGETVYRFVDVENVSTGFSDTVEGSIRRDRIVIKLELIARGSESLAPYLRVNPFLSNAYAIPDCDDFYATIYNQQMEDLVILRDDLDVTNDFVARSISGSYVEIKEALAIGTGTVWLYYTEIPQENQIGFTVQTTLSDGRVFEDEISIFLR